MSILMENCISVKEFLIGESIYNFKREKDIEV